MARTFARRVLLTALTVVISGVVATDGHAQPPPPPDPPPRPMVLRNQDLPRFSLTWRAAPNLGQLGNFTRRTPEDLVRNPAWLTHQARQQCPEARNPMTGALRPGVIARDWYCLNQQDSVDEDWSLQGLTGSEDASQGGTVDGQRPLVLVWYHRPPNAPGTPQNPPDRARLSFLVPSSGRYANIELVTMTGDPNTPFASIGTHAGGTVWHGNHLYVSSHNAGLRVFDMRNILDLGPQPPGNYQFVLPQIGTWRNQNQTNECDPGSNRPCYDYATLDRSAQSWQFMTGEYCSERDSAGHLAQCGSRIARWRIEDIASRTGTITAREVYRQPATNVQGGVSYIDPSSQRRCYHFSSSRGAHRRGWLISDRPNVNPGYIRAAVGLQDLYVWRSRSMLWTGTEWPGVGKRIIYGVNLSDLQCP